MHSFVKKNYRLPLWVFTGDHETAAVGQLMDGLGVVFKSLF